MIPSKIRIGCWDYEVQQLDGPVILDNKTCYSDINYETHIIRMTGDRKLSGQHRERDFWHELVHGIINYRDINLKDDEEAVVEELAVGLYGLCRDNGLLPGQRKEVMLDGEGHL